MKKHLPAFANETEEADYWYTTREERAKEFVAAAAEGRVKGGGIVRYLAQLEKAKKLLPNEDDATRLTELAFKKDIDVEVYLNDLVHQAILQETDRAA